MSDYGQRLYDWWSRHPLAQRLLYGTAFFGREGTFRQRGVDGLALDSGERVLDVGCGPGTNFERLRAAVGAEGVVVGVDYSAGMVRAARERVRREGWSNVHVVRGDAARPPVETGTFDAALASMSLSAMPDLPGVLDATRRALRPGGRLAVLDAQPFQSLPWVVLNPVVSVLFSLTTNWNPAVDVPAALREAFPEVTVDTYAGGSLLVARADANTSP